MRTLANILWYFPFFGFVTAILVTLFGLLLTATIIAAPVGLGLIELGKFLFKPFGNSMISKNELNANRNKTWNAYSNVILILYIPFGLFFAFLVVFQIVGLFISIIGIPAALVLAKSLGTYLNPVNKKCVPSAVAEELERRKAQGYVDKHFEKVETNLYDTSSKTEQDYTISNNKAIQNEVNNQASDYNNQPANDISSINNEAELNIILQSNQPSEETTFNKEKIQDDVNKLTNSNSNNFSLTENTKPSNIKPHELSTISIFGNWFENNKKGLIASVVSIITVLFLIVATKFVISLDFNNRENNKTNMVESEEINTLDKKDDREESKDKIFNKSTSKYTGLIDGIPVHLQYSTINKLNCSEEGAMFKGFYYYDQYGENKKVNIKGSYCGSIFTFDEYYPNGKKAGHFSGIIGNGINGTLESGGNSYECLFFK
jgi:uncharacterized membrane protein YccF (DUF307 family)